MIKAQNLKVKIGTKKEALWTKVKEEAQALIEDSENNLIIQEAMLKLAETKIEEEKKQKV